MTGFREYTITFRTDDYICRDGYDLTLDDLLDELCMTVTEHFEAEALDMVVWEDDRILAVVRFSGEPDAVPSVTRFDFHPAVC